MTKLFYDPGTYADRDDAVYHAAVAAGQVGEKCLLGGPAIEQYMPESPDDVCAVCPVAPSDRTLCGGRPQKKARTATKTLDVNAEVAHNQDKTAAAYRARQERFAQSIRQQTIAQEAIRKKDIP